MIDFLITIVGLIISGYLGSVEWRLRSMNEKMSLAMSRTEVDDLISLKQESLKITQADLKEDINRLETKIDKLIEMQLKK